MHKPTLLHTDWVSLQKDSSDGGEEDEEESNLLDQISGLCEHENVEADEAARAHYLAAQHRLG
jgi:hypothetical protein